MYIKKLTAAALVAAIAVFAWVDTSAYRNSVQAFSVAVPAEQLQKQMDEVANDAIVLQKCVAIGRDPAQSSELRICLLDAIPKIRTPATAIQLSFEAAQFLGQHSSDTEIRDAALVGIKNARANLLASVLTFDAFTATADARNSSILLRAFYGVASTERPFVVFSDLLARAEIQILLPEVADQQAEHLRAGLVSNRPST